MRVSLKYGAVSIGAQFTACAGFWLAAILFSSDSLFNIILYFYWPTIILVALVLGTSGESAMIAVPIYGMGLGMLLYGAIIGLLVSYIKTRTR